MDIDKFSPAKHLLWANRTSGAGYSGQNVYVTGESLAEGLSLGTAIRTTFTGLQVQTIGTSPLELNIPSNFVPVQTTVVLSNTTTPFDFEFGNQVVIDCGFLFQLKIEMQSIIDDIPFVSTYGQVSGKLGYPYILTTEGRGDATEGDSTVDVYVFGYYL